MPAVSCNVVSRTQELLLASRTTLPCAAEFLTPLLVQLPAKSLSSGQQCVLTTSMSASCAANELNCCLVFCFLLSAFRYVLLFMQAKHKFSKVLVCGKLIFFLLCFVCICKGAFLLMLYLLLLCFMCRTDSNEKAKGGECAKFE